MYPDFKNDFFTDQSKPALGKEIFAHGCRDPPTQVRDRGETGLIQRVAFHNDESGFCFPRESAEAPRADDSRRVTALSDCRGLFRGKRENSHDRTPQYQERWVDFVLQ